jgi:putative transcriptional regulator
MNDFTLKEPPQIPPAAGKLLIAHPFLKDSHFTRTVVLLCEHSDEGSLGFVLNQDTDLLLGDILVELASSTEKIYQGGPVQPETLHMIHHLPQQLKGKEIGDGIFWGGSFDELTETILMHQYHAGSLKLFLGYSGWASGQLEEELKQGAWLVAHASTEIVFETSPLDVWQRSIASLGNEYRYLSQLPIDPQLN